MLEVQDLTAAYGDLVVLWNINLNVKAGELVAVVGANSAGKTTLLRCIVGLHRTMRGDIRFLGRHLHRLPVHRIARLGIGLVSERTVFPDLSVAENLSLGKLAGREFDATVPRADSVIELFPELANRQAQLAGSLSGGERQMLAISRALMGNPRLLLLDEPSTGIAPKVVERIMEALKRLHARGVTLLLVDQYVTDALSMADRAYVLERGRVVAEDTGRRLLDNPTVRRAYLGL